ncbi:hypothetical protein RGQ29_002804 [Quercus rubra]|uniref:Lipoxygenase n=1 Tax=Quercus rubra TaxID=3512 RepID=A0AAN7E9V4_QUERU|nr:hypothetical protein RGQ29_002804 [Quercus rubra]
MAMGKEIMGGSMIERSSFVSSTKVFLNHGKNNNMFLVKHLEKRRAVVPLRKVVKGPVVAAVSEDQVKSLLLVSVPAEKAEKFKVRAVVTVKNKNKQDFKDKIVKHLDCLTDNIGRNIVLQLVSTEIDPKTKSPRKSNEAVLKDWSKKSNVKAERVNYTAEFMLNSNFGVPGAITVSNNHQMEFFLETITIEGFAFGPVHFPCNSWVQSRKDHPEKRIFFSNKGSLKWDFFFFFGLVYQIKNIQYVANGPLLEWAMGLKTEPTNYQKSIKFVCHIYQMKTPGGLRSLREKELRDIRGDGKGVRKLSDRVYDFDVYNDLGKPDKGIDLARPTLGGEKIPYPRRCRTGRLPTDTDMHAESRVEKPLPMYVPRDEQFEESKQDTVSAGRLKAFKGFLDIDNLYSEGVLLELGLKDELVKKLPLPKVVSNIQESNRGITKYDTPRILSKDKFAWLRDDEFARQAIAGIIHKLDPEIYGPQESALKEEHILGYLNGMTVQQVLNIRIEENKLFILDHHDAYLPFLQRINALDGRKAYATRTIFFLTSLGTLTPIAIELSLPPSGPSSCSKRVVRPAVDATTNWLWQLAKAHVCSNDVGVHQLVNHWLRTHASMEPFILATHRQMSAMHPIFKLLDPHMRYTMEINASARQTLVNADGVIESCFTPGQYAMEISAAAYKSSWRFDMESLPADLIRRGMAVPDPHNHMV